MVELALTLPVLILILLIIFEGGRIFAGYLELEHAAREGARYASIGKSDSEITDIIKNNLVIVDSTSPKFVITVSPPERSVGDPITVGLEYELDIYTPLISDIIGTTFPIRSQVVMRVE